MYITIIPKWVHGVEVASFPWLKDWVRVQRRTLTVVLCMYLGHHRGDRCLSLNHDSLARVPECPTGFGENNTASDGLVKWDRSRKGCERWIWRLQIITWLLLVWRLSLDSCDPTKLSFFPPTSLLSSASGHCCTYWWYYYWYYMPILRPTLPLFLEKRPYLGRLVTPSREEVSTCI